MTTWIKDENGNSASVEFWGSEDAARKSIASLVNCRDCEDCAGCSGCYECKHCYGCKECHLCDYCDDSSYCSGCFECCECTACFACSGCDDKSGWHANMRVHITIPLVNYIDRKVYEAASAPGALDMKNWHCGTAHCRAGWVVTIAGEKGAALEKLHGTEFAAALIYWWSGSPINTRRFYDTKGVALDDMRRRAVASAGSLKS